METNVWYVCPGRDLAELDGVKLPGIEILPGVRVLKVNPEDLGRAYGQLVSTNDIHSCMMASYLKNAFGYSAFRADQREEFITSVVDTVVHEVLLAMRRDPKNQLIVVLHTSMFAEPFETRQGSDRAAIAYQQIADSQNPKSKYRGDRSCCRKFNCVTKHFSSPGHLQAEIRGQCSKSRHANSRWCWYARPEGVRKFMLSVLYGGEGHIFYANCRHAEQRQLPEMLGGSVFEIYKTEEGRIVITDVLRLQGKPLHDQPTTSRIKILADLALPEGVVVAKFDTEVCRLRSEGPPEKGATIFLRQTADYEEQVYAWKSYKILKPNQAFLQFDRRRIAFSSVAQHGALIKQAGSIVGDAQCSAICPATYLCEWVGNSWKIVRPARFSERMLTSDVTVELIKKNANRSVNEAADFGGICDALSLRQP